MGGSSHSETWVGAEHHNADASLIGVPEPWLMAYLQQIKPVRERDSTLHPSSCSWTEALAFLLGKVTNGCCERTGKNVEAFV